MLHPGKFMHNNITCKTPFPNFSFRGPAELEAVVPFFSPGATNYGEVLRSGHTLLYDFPKLKDFDIPVENCPCHFIDLDDYLVCFQLSSTITSFTWFFYLHSYQYGTTISL